MRDITSAAGRLSGVFSDQNNNTSIILNSPKSAYDDDDAYCDRGISAMTELVNRENESALAQFEAKHL
jgi:hypothetical protein